MKKGTKRKLRLAALALMVACLVPMLAGCDVGLTKMGYIDKEGNTVIEGLYQMAQPFHEGLAGVTVSYTHLDVYKRQNLPIRLTALLFAHVVSFI